MSLSKSPASTRGKSRIASAAFATLLAVLATAGGASAQTCLDDVAGSTGCTANDFGVSSITVNEVLDDGCVGDGDTFTFNGEFNVAGGRPDRYDVGFYIGRDGVQALTGQCSVHIIPKAVSNSDGDTCGDYLGNAIVVPVSNVTVTCNDGDGDGFFDLALCNAYHQNGNPTCDGPANALPGTSSKCDCLQVNTTLETPHCEDDPTLCVDDGNPCTNTVCNSRASGLGDFFGCSNNNNSNSCNDGLFCNGTDFCSAGSCSGHNGDPCSGGGTCSVCSEANDNCFASSATVCRASAGACDIAENCTGSSTICPANDFADSGVCRAANGACDVAESCNGSSANCPIDGFANSGVCRAANGVCDVAESCNGSSAACPPNGFANSGVCRPADGICDAAESCNGSSANCPADGFANSGVCRAASGVCDAAESCNGSSAQCPNDAFAPTSVECRADQGVCDVAENCTGSSATCPANGFEPSGTACTSDGNVCTDDECDGSGNCENTNNTDPCDDGAFCTENDVCSAGACGGTPLVCDDGVDCTNDTCDEGANACAAVADNANCDDGNACTEDICSAVNGCISNIICIEEICRSPGYWSTHSGVEKEGSKNISQLLIDHVGPIEVCGQTITKTVNASSPYLAGLGLTSNLEGLCMRSRGVKQRQLYRQLTAAALNCAISGANSNCDAVTDKFLDVKFSECSALCAGTPVADGPSVGECIGAMGCFNGGGQFINGQCVRGLCASQPDLLCGGDAGDCPDFEGEPQECDEFLSCHDAELCNENLGFCPKQSKASSPKACKEARFNTCTIDSCD